MSATTCFLEPFYWVDDQIIGQFCSIEEEGDPNPLLAYRIDPESATLTSGQVLEPVGGMIG